MSEESHEFDKGFNQMIKDHEERKKEKNEEEE